MNLAFEPEEETLQSAAAALLERLCPVSDVRKSVLDNQVDSAPAIWRAGVDQGWLAVGLPEDVGGLGLGAFAEAILFRELGRFVTPGPFLSTVIAAHLAIEVAQPELAESILSGAAPIGYIVGGFGLDVETDGLALQFTPSGATLVRVPECKQIEAIDATTKLSEVSTGDVVVESQSPELLPRARLLVAAQLTGITEAVRDMSGTYATQRIQFGKPIGTFQAVKHRCANMAVAAYACNAQLLFTARLIDAEDQAADFNAACALNLGIRSANQSTRDNIQNHGAIGFTLEHDAHLYLRRALVLERWFAPDASLRDAILSPRRVFSGAGAESPSR